MSRWNGHRAGCRLLVAACALNVAIVPLVVAEQLGPQTQAQTSASVQLNWSSTFLTNALTILFGRDQGVVFVGPHVHNIFAGSPQEVVGELHGGFRFSVEGPDPNPAHVCTQLHVYDYVIYNSDGKLRKIYADVDMSKSGYGNVSSVYPEKVRQAFEAALPAMERDLNDPQYSDPYTFYYKYIQLFFPLNIQLHSNLLIPPTPGMHGQLYNRQELYVQNDGPIDTFPLEDTPFVASGAEFVERDTGKVLLTVEPGWKLKVTSFGQLDKLSIDVVEEHLANTHTLRTF